MAEAKKFYRPGSKRTKEFLLAKTMMVLVFVFLILNTPRLILGLIEVRNIIKIENVFILIFLHWHWLSWFLHKYLILIWTRNGGEQRYFIDGTLPFIYSFGKMSLEYANDWLKKTPLFRIPVKTNENWFKKEKKSQA